MLFIQFDGIKRAIHSNATLNFDSNQFSIINIFMVKDIFIVYGYCAFIALLCLIMEILINSKIYRKQNR